eukprot:3628143-Rhodomonas_salina.11
MPYTSKSNPRNTESPNTLYQACVFLHLISGCSSKCTLTIAPEALSVPGMLQYALGRDGGMSAASAGR